MSEGTHVLQAFCRFCHNEVDVTQLSPMDEFACRRCYGIQRFDGSQLNTTSKDPMPGRIFAGTLAAQSIVFLVIGWRAITHGSSAAAAFTPLFLAVGITATLFTRIRSRGILIGSGLLASGVFISWVCMMGYVVGRPALRAEWTGLIYLATALISAGLFLLVGEILRLSRTLRV